LPMTGQLNLEASEDAMKRDSPGRIRLRRGNVMGVRAGVGLLWAGTAAVFIFLLFRNSGLYPVVFGDEYIYSTLSRHKPLSSADIPTYLFLSVYGLSSFCGDGFLECVRVLNAVFFVLAAPFIYLVGARVLPGRVAAYVAVLSTLGPVNTYTAYFMPEAMYYLAFWIFSWFALEFRDWRPAVYGLACGLILGLMTLIKVHGIFVVPAFAAFAVYVEATRGSAGGKWTGKALRVAGYAAIAAVFTRLSLGYLFGGTAGFNFIGSFYGQYAGAAAGLGRYVQLGSQALENLAGHAMGLAILFGVPLASLCSWRANPGADPASERDRLTIQAYLVTNLLAILPVVTVFTASVAGVDNQTLTRLHMRYYSFAFPIFIIIAAAQPPAQTSPQGRAPTIVAGALVAILAAWSLAFLPARYSPGFVDSPEVWGVMQSAPFFYYLLGVFGVIAIFAWSVNRKVGGRLFAFLVMPLLLLVASYHVSGELRRRLVADSVDEAGIFARSYLGKDTPGLVFVGGDRLTLYRAMFHADNPRAMLLVSKSGASLDPGAIPEGINWLMVLGDHGLPGNFKVHLDLGDYLLAKAEGFAAIDFTRGSWPGVIAQTQGLSAPEPWGTWSDGTAVVLDFASPLPRDFTLRFTAVAFGPNADQPFTIRVGDVRKTFSLSSTPKEVTVDIRTESAQERITIEVPAPTSQKALGTGDDPRHLGIGFVGSLTVSSLPAAPEAGSR